VKSSGNGTDGRGGGGMAPSLDARLGALFSRLDTSAGFEQGVLARVNVEAAAALDRERIERARAAEWHRYGEARSELSLGNSLRELWARYLGRFVTLETAGAAVLLGLVLQFAWSRLPPEWIAQIRQLSEYTPQMLVALGVLMALAPLAVMAFGRYRHRLTLA
jgi:hypothetical protein